VSINIGEEVLSSAGMFEGVGEEIVKLVIIGVKRVNFIVEIVFELIHIILFLVVIVLGLFDVLKFSQVLLVLHIVYTFKRLHGE
jgi:hypothetical protein